MPRKLLIVRPIHARLSYFTEHVVAVRRMIVVVVQESGQVLLLLLVGVLHLVLVGGVRSHGAGGVSRVGLHGLHSLYVVYVGAAHA